MFKTPPKGMVKSKDCTHEAGMSTEESQVLRSVREQENNIIELDAKQMTRKTPASAKNSIKTWILNSQVSPKTKTPTSEAKILYTTIKSTISSLKFTKMELKDKIVSAAERLFELVKELEKTNGDITARVDTSQLVGGEQSKEENTLNTECGSDAREILMRIEEQGALIRKNNDKIEQLKLLIEKQDKTDEIREKKIINKIETTTFSIQSTYASIVAGQKSKGERNTVASNLKPTALHSLIVTSTEQETSNEIIERIKTAVNAKRPE
ncbi:unnamed protein product [Pieris macdunnoughi]|uniref:Uncharacterized protein n=1 Tax=Pieris macdunnoughi TaxID=345717 RepID=A0A821TPE1_9NEOP|nr:unnamed protein product [Pieris macdunnoughi]